MMASKKQHGVHLRDATCVYLFEKTAMCLGWTYPGININQAEGKSNSMLLFHLVQSQYSKHRWPMKQIDTNRALTHWHSKLIQGLSWFLPPPTATTTTTATTTNKKVNNNITIIHLWKKTDHPAWEGEMPHGLNHLTQSGGFRAGSLSIVGGFNILVKLYMSLLRIVNSDPFGRMMI